MPRKPAIAPITGGRGNALAAGEEAVSCSVVTGSDLGVVKSTLEVKENSL